MDWKGRWRIGEECKFGAENCDRRSSWCYVDLRRPYGRRCSILNMWGMTRLNLDDCKG